VSKIIWWEPLNEREGFQDFGMNGMIILKYNFKMIIAEYRAGSCDCIQG